MLRSDKKGQKKRDVRKERGLPLCFLFLLYYAGSSLRIENTRKHKYTQTYTLGHTHTHNACKYTLPRQWKRQV